MVWLEELKKKIKNIDKGIALVNIIVFTAFIIFIAYKEDEFKELDKERKQHTRYTIGITTKERHNPRSSSKAIYFRYCYQDTTYTNFELVGWLDNSVLTDGGRYYVEFSYLNPGNSKMFFDRPVPSHIMNPPYTGWASIP